MEHDPEFPSCICRKFLVISSDSAVVQNSVYVALEYLNAYLKMVTEKNQF